MIEIEVLTPLNLLELAKYSLLCPISFVNISPKSGKVQMKLEMLLQASYHYRPGLIVLKDGPKIPSAGRLEFPVLRELAEGLSNHTWHLIFAN